jgi:hypothetical protein
VLGREGGGGGDGKSGSPSPRRSLGQFRLPNPREDNADDELVLFAIYSYTKDSGLDEIDKMESNAVLRNVPSGTGYINIREVLGGRSVDIPLCITLVESGAKEGALLQAAAGNTSVLAAPGNILSEQVVEEITNGASEYSKKFILRIQATILDGPRVERYLSEPIPAFDPKVRLMYESPGMVHAARALWASLEMSYMITATDLPLPPGNEGLIQQFRYACNPNEAVSENLHLLRADLPNGPQLPIAWCQQDLAQRGLNADEEGAVSSDATAQFFESNVLSALLRRGMSVQHFINTVTKQCEDRSERMRSSFITAKEAVCDVAMFLCNQTNYEMDMAYPNLDWLDAQPLEVKKMFAPALYNNTSNTKSNTPSKESEREPKMTTPSIRYERYSNKRTGKGRHKISCGDLIHLAMAAQETASRRHRPAYYGSSNAAAPAVTAGPFASYRQSKVVFLGDRWETAPLAGETNSTDCEEGGFAQPCMLDVLGEFCRTDEMALKRPLLRAVGILLDKFVVFMAGMISTEPKVETNPTSSRGPAAGHVKAPVIGSKEDKLWPENGHSPAVLESKYAVAKKLYAGVEDGNIHPDDEAMVKGKLKNIMNASLPWEKNRRLKLAVLEGTGSTRQEALSIEETYEGTDRADVFLRKGAALLQFVRRLKTKADPEVSLLFDFGRVQGQAYELFKQESNQRSNGFYKSWVHFSSSWMARQISPVFGQVFAAKRQERVRGVDIGEYDRNEGDNIALVSPYAAFYSTEWWNGNVQPYVNCMRNMQQMSAWGRKDLPVAQKIGQVLTTANIRALATTNFSEDEALGAALDAFPVTPVTLPKTDEKYLNTVINADESNTHVVLPLFIPAWKFPLLGSTKMSAMLDALETLCKRGDIDGYVFVRDQPLARCASCVQLLLALKVPDEIDESIFPRT